MSKTGLFVVSGASSGIGLAIARKILAEGYAVFGLGRSAEKLGRVSDNPNFYYHAVDLADADMTHDAVKALRALGLPVLGLVNNAGVYERTPFHSTPDAAWETQFNVNLLSAVRLTRELYPELSWSKGSVLNISSTLGLKPVAHTSAYSALKAAMVSFTKTLALEWAEFGIRANCICPGIVDTPIHEFKDEQTKNIYHGMQPLKRMGQPEEIAAACWFLLSDQSAWTTGAVLSVDGGISLL